MTFGAKMLRVLLFLGCTFMNVARHDKAWYHYKDVCACWESMRLSSLHRLAISSNSIKTYLLQSIWQGQHVLVIKNDSGRAPFWSGNYISHHRPSTNVDSMAFPQTCQIARVRGRQFCTQENLRVQLQKMEAGASDHETVAVSWLCWDELLFHRFSSS